MAVGVAFPEIVAALVIGVRNHLAVARGDVPVLSTTFGKVIVVILPSQSQLNCIVATGDASVVSLIAVPLVACGDYLGNESPSSPIR